MKIQANLKDVVLIPENGWEREEIERLTGELDKDSPNATIHLKFDTTPLQLYQTGYEGTITIKGIRTMGDVPAKW